MPVEDYGECREDYGNHNNEVVREVLTYLIPRLVRIEKFLLHLEKIEMSNQDKIDALTAKLAGMGNDVAALVTSQATLIQTTTDLSNEVKALIAAQANGEVLNFDAANAAADAADAAVLAAKTAADNANTANPDPGPQAPPVSTPAPGATGQGVNTP